MSEYNARKRPEKLYKIDRFYYSRNLPLIKRFVNVCFMHERSAINFLNEDKNGSKSLDEYLIPPNTRGYLLNNRGYLVLRAGR
jgi:hypothetical protein